MRGGQLAASERAMKKPDVDELRPEYEFSRGVRGKYSSRLAKGANVVVLDRDLIKLPYQSLIKVWLQEKLQNS
jgi:hypothetical protein